MLRFLYAFYIIYFKIFYLKVLLIFASISMQRINTTLDAIMLSKDVALEQNMEIISICINWLLSIC